jgi:hypothetical protein
MSLQTTHAADATSQPKCNHEGCVGSNHNCGPNLGLRLYKSSAKAKWWAIRLNGRSVAVGFSREYEPKDRSLSAPQHTVSSQIEI